MTARLLQITALSAALFATPALARSHKHSRHHTLHRHAARASRSHRREIAKADDAVPAPAPATPAATDENGDAMPAGGRHVVTHSIYDASADKAE